VADAVQAHGAAFLDSVVRVRDLDRDAPVLLATSGRSLAASKRMASFLSSAAGICPPPESTCFDGQRGTLMRVEQPVASEADTITVEVGLGYFHPDARYTWPPGAATSPRAGPKVPAVEGASSSWTLWLRRDRTTGAITRVRTGFEIASDAF
jgi:hypothetical protein